MPEFPEIKRKLRGGGTLDKKGDILGKIKNGVIVSCQALENEPLYGSDTMVKMAVGALMGGAKGIRSNSVEDIKTIKQNVDLPIIGIIKREYEGSDCYITATMKEVDELVEQAKPHIVAVDGTKRRHPDGTTGEEFVAAVRKKYPDILLMADISTLEEAVSAEKAGVDLVSTTLSGYTPYSPQIEGPDFELMSLCSRELSIPVIAEGRIWCPEEANAAFMTGVSAIVVGTAITRPREITRRFVERISGKDVKCYIPSCPKLCDDKDGAVTQSR